MRQDCLSVLSVVAVFSYLCLVKGIEGGDILRRFLYADAHHSIGCLHECLHGLCDTHFGTTHCRCDHGWTGSRCNVSLDCHHCLHGSCSSFTGHCLCHDGWTGTACDKPLDCHHTCLHGSCSSLSGHCRCHDGWTGSACDEPVEIGTCRHNSDCHSVIRCDLNTRAICYFGQMCACVPIHNDRRMRFVNGGVQYVNVNGDNQYGGVQSGNGGVQYGNGGVQYGNGGVLFGGIQNNNQQQTVGRGSHCGPYYCTHGSCQYTNMGGVETHSCTCNHGWHGDHCDQPDHVTSYHAKDCTNHQCFHGHCERDMYNNEHCKCNDGWTGYQCQIQVAPTVQISGPLDNCNNHCGEHGTCTMHHSQQGHEYWSCKCDRGWHGNHCGYQHIVPTTTTTTSKPDAMVGNNYDQACNYHGYWTHSGCHCHDHWTGDKCQYPPGSGPQDHCYNHCGEHGTCTMHRSHHGKEYWNCECDHGWHGNFCTFQYIVTNTTHCYNTYCVNGDCTYLQDIMGHQWNHHCQCHYDWEGNHCDQEKTRSSLSPPTTTTSTTTLPTTTKTTTAPTTKQTTLPPASATSPAVATLSVAHISTTNIPPTQTTAITVATCNHVDTLSAIAQQTSVSNQNAIECSPGVHTSHEALVLTDCSVSQSPALWKQGVNVMTACSSNAIPNYTPIAAFDHGQYSSIGSLSGIFLGCTSDGFKMVVQTCGQTPYIAELHLGGSNTQNPNMYFTIS